MSGASWLDGWQTDDVLSSTELAKSGGGFYDSTLGTIAASFDITSMPGWGATIKLELVGRGDTSASTVAVNIRFNGDNVNNYYNQRQNTNASTVSAAESLTANAGVVGVVAASLVGTAHAGMLEAVIPQFRGTTFYTEYSSSGGWSQGTLTGNIWTDRRQGLWLSNAAITRITVLPASGNFVAGSRCIARVFGP